MSDEGSPTSLLDHIVTTDGLDRNLVKAITSNTTSQASSPSNATTGQDGNTALASPSSPLAATKRTAGGYHMPSGAAVTALKNSSFTTGSPKPKATEEGARPRQRSIAFADAQGAEGTAPSAKSKGVRADSSEKVHRPPLSPQAKPAQQPTLGGEAQLAQSSSGPGYFIDAEEADSEELDEVEGLGELAPMTLKGKKGMIREGGGIPSFVGTARWHASPSKEKMKLLSGYFSETSSSGHGSALEDDEDSGLVGSKRRSRSNSGYGTVNGADPHHHQHHHSSSRIPSTKASGGLFGWFGRTQSNSSVKDSHDGGSPQVRTRRVVNAVFSKDGSLNVATTGVSIRKLLWSQEWYFAITGATWPQLLLGSFFMWLTVGICIASLYYAASAYCGARRSVVMAFYFNVVSLAANGGYLGEDPIMIDPVGHPKCFELRTLIVMIASYLNILCVGFIAAVMLAKAAAPASLKYRIVFSDLIVAREIYTAPDAVVASPALASPASDKKAPNKRVPHGALVAKAFRQLTDRAAPSPSKAATEADNSSDPRRVTRVGSNSKDDGAKGLLSYLLQFRIGNVSQDADKAVLSGELHVFLVTMEIVDIRKRSVQSRCYELPWAALEEDHDDDEIEEEDGFANDEDGDDDDAEGMELDPATASQSGIFRHNLNGEGSKKSKSTGGRANSSRDASELYAYDFGTSKSLRLWFPVSASIAVSPDCSTRAIRLLYNLLIRHSRAGLRNKNLRYAHDANIENVFDFQIVTEYRAQDTKTGGSSFVARYAYAPSDILRKFRFSDTCAYLSSITYQNIVNTYGIEAGGSSSPKMPHSITAAAASLLPSIEVDFSQFNVVEPDV